MAKTDRTAEARQYYRHAIPLSPSLVVAHYKLAQLLLGQGHIAAAAAEFRIVLELDPEHEGARRSLDEIGPAGDPPPAP